MLLTTDGQVAGVSKDVKGNAMGIYNESGLSLFLGDETLPLSGTIGANSCYKQIVSISQYKMGEISIGPVGSGVSGDLELKAGSAIAENARFFDYGQPVSRDSLGALIKYADLSYIRRNWAGDADLIQLHAGDKQGHYYGRARVFTDDAGDKNVIIDTGKAADPSALKTGVVSSYPFRSGSYYYVRLNSQNSFAFIDEMGKLVNVKESAFIGKSAVTFGANTYDIPADIMCYVPSSGTWLDLDAALAYSDTFNLYSYNGTIQVMEIAE
jgi:hypothetical protein